MSIPYIRISPPDFYGEVRIISKEPIGIDLILYLEDFSCNIINEFYGVPNKSDTILAMEDKLNRELILLDNAGIMRKDHSGKWCLNRMLKLNNINVKEIYRRMLIKEGDYVY